MTSPLSAAPEPHTLSPTGGARVAEHSIVTSREYQRLTKKDCVFSLASWGVTQFGPQVNPKSSYFISL